MDDYHFSNIAKTTNFFVLNHIWENKILIFFKNGHILHNGNNVVKDLMNIFLNSHRIHRYCKSI
jgi:hypothetical protein